MKTRRMVAVAVTLIVASLCLFAIAGCAPGEQEYDPAEDRAYMSRANTTMMQLNADLEQFTEAVAAEDVVTMEKAASAAYRDMDAFKSITPPDAMKDIHAEYCAGCDDLKSALQAYIDLYKSAPDSDVKEINASIAEIQATYDSGIAHLQKADKMVSELPGATPETSSSTASSSEQSSSEESSHA